MIRFKYRFCNVHMARFVNGDLAEPTRRRVARYIDECEDCYREYMQHREFAHKLERSLPTLGNPGAAKLDKIWTALQADMKESPARPHWQGDMGPPTGAKFSYGLAIVAMMIVLLLPLIISIHSARLSVELPLLPRYAAQADTAASPAPAYAIGATAEPRTRLPAPLLQNTPAPSL